MIAKFVRNDKQGGLNNQRSEINKQLFRSMFWNSYFEIALAINPGCYFAVGRTRLVVEDIFIRLC